MAMHGSCHCGKVAYALDEDAPAKAMDCNCSICRRKGYLHHFTGVDKFTLQTPREEIDAYTFGKHSIRHQFCRTCGCAAFCEGETPDGKAMVSVNLRCAEGIDLGKLEIVPFDGASL
jgi:hypothetical protein